jgi:hypothetical protein
MSPDVAFRLLRDHELQRGHAILCEAFQWLMHHNIKQWTAPTPMGVYQEWQRNQRNYGLFVAGELAVVLSLVEGPLDEWRDVADCNIVLWLHALATATRFKGGELGRQAVRCAMRLPRLVPLPSICLCLWQRLFALLLSIPGISRGQARK